jgi:hypothetical protein
MYGIEPEDDASSLDFYFKRIHPEDRLEVEQVYAAALLRKTEKLIVRKIIGLFFQTERSKTSAVSAIPSWTNAATSWNLSGPQ